MQAAAARTEMCGRSPRRQARTRSMTKTRPTAAPSRKASLRAIEASPTRSPAAAYDFVSPRSPRAANHRVAATSGWKIAKFSGCGMNTVPAAGMAARTAAPSCTVREAPMSRAISQVSGAASEPMSTIGSADAIAVAPMSTMNGAWMNDARGSQCAFDGMGRTASAGNLPPTSAKIQTKSTFSPCPLAERPRHVDVVERIRVGRVGEQEHQPGANGERKPVQEQRDSHGRCRVAPGRARRPPVRND